MEVLQYRKDINSPWQKIIAIKGEPGEKYVLTDEEVELIAARALEMLPVVEEVKY